MLNGTDTRSEYDLPTAVTFLCVGLSLGAIIAILFSPLQGNGKRAVASRSSAAECNQ